MENFVVVLLILQNVFGSLNANIEDLAAEFSEQDGEKMCIGSSSYNPTYTTTMQNYIDNVKSNGFDLKCTAANPPPNVRVTYPYIPVSTTTTVRTTTVRTRPTPPPPLPFYEEPCQSRYRRRRPVRGPSEMCRKRRSLRARRYLNLVDMGLPSGSQYSLQFCNERGSLNPSTNTLSLCHQCRYVITLPSGYSPREHSHVTCNEDHSGTCLCGLGTCVKNVLETPVTKPDGTPDSFWFTKSCSCQLVNSWYNCLIPLANCY